MKNKASGPLTAFFKSGVKLRITSTLVAVLAVGVGALLIVFGDSMLGSNLALFYGLQTFSGSWSLSVVAVPFGAGIVVSLIYGLGGKIYAHFAPLLVRIIEYVAAHQAGAIPSDAAVLPLGYWCLIVLLTMEFCAIGGFVGEIVVKKTYGRSDKRKLHKKFQKSEVL